MPEETVEITDEQMLSVAEQFDAAKEAGEVPNVEIPEEPKEEVQDESPPEATEEAVEEPETEVLDSTEDNADEQVSSLTEGEAPEAEEQPKKSKWAKNEERKQNSWKEINSRKEENKRKGLELDELKKELEIKREELNSGKAYRDEEGRTVSDYEEAAKILEDSGATEQAAKTLEKAKMLQEESARVQQDVEAKKVSDITAREFSLAKSELEAEKPELKDIESPLTKETNLILREHPDLMYVPNGDGLRYAVKIAGWKVDASKAEKSEAENKELTDKLNKLEKKMSVSGGFTSEKVDGDRSFDDLSEKEQESHLLKAAMNFDDA